MNYKEAVKYIENIQLSLGSDYSLREVTELCERVKRPDRKVKIIHLAGTNGKGSVGTYLTNMLVESGYTVGRYLSPTILDYRERVQLLGRTHDYKRLKSQGIVQKVEESERLEKLKESFASEEEIAACLTILREHAEEMVKEGYHQPTAFEIETVMAFMLFEQWQVDIAIVECGLGGRLDATNFIEAPLMCLFTSISKDHMGVLGNSLEEIAQEKYGIIKKNALVVSGVQKFCINILDDICREKNAQLYLADMDGIEAVSIKLNHNRFRYVSHSSTGLAKDAEEDEVYELAQNGVYQMENAALAITAAEVLKKNEFAGISQTAIKEALLKSYWYGRFEVVATKPLVIVDGAHNEDGALRLKESLMTYFPNEKFHFIMGMYQDKEYEKVLDIMMPLAQSLYTIPTKGARSLSAEKLADSAKRFTLEANQIRICENVSQAIEEAIQGKIIIFGSLSFINEIYEYFGKKE